MGIVQDLVTKLQGCEENMVVAANSQEESDLFLEINQTCTAETNKEQVGGKILIINSKFYMDFFSFILTYLELLILKWPLCLGPAFCTWLRLQASMFGAVVFGSGDGCFASSHTESRQIKAPMCSTE